MASRATPLCLFYLPCTPSARLMLPGRGPPAGAARGHVSSTAPVHLSLLFCLSARRRPVRDCPRSSACEEHHPSSSTPTALNRNPHLPRLGAGMARPPPTLRTKISTCARRSVLQLF